MYKLLLLSLTFFACSADSLRATPPEPAEAGYTSADPGLEYCRGVCTGSPDVRLWSPNNKTDLWCICYCPAGNGADLSFDARMPREKAEQAWSRYTSVAGCG